MEGCPRPILAIRLGWQLLSARYQVWTDTHFTRVVDHSSVIAFLQVRDVMNGANFFTGPLKPSDPSAASTPR